MHNIKYKRKFAKAKKCRSSFMNFKIKIGENMFRGKLKTVAKTCMYVGLSGLCVSIAHAAPADMPAEIQAIQAGTAGYITGISYIVGAGSGAVGVWKFVETQSLKVAAIAGSVSILAFKFPGWVTAAAVI